MRDGIETACYTHRPVETARHTRVRLEHTHSGHRLLQHAAPDTRPDTRTRTDTRRAKVLVLVIADSVLLIDGMPLTAGDHRAGDMHSTHTQTVGY